ncbi:MAG: prepilin-type N-terminal cleavage/methylation domain-containing protein [Burkholderiales bacterium]|nr:prepilin-type N-terminal cleavage/methylation domain-containing protein [Burkholderiales bacterium]
MRRTIRMACADTAVYSRKINIVSSRRSVTIAASIGPFGGAAGCNPALSRWHETRDLRARTTRSREGVSMNAKRMQGFTLIEIAIVLVIIGLLLGGILKGQELITSARVRNLISQQDGVRAAFYGFQDRYRAVPGDYSNAITNIQGATTNGNGNGQIEPTGATAVESNLVWEHLSKSGFINGNYTYSATAGELVVPKNPYGQYVRLAWDQVYLVPADTTAVDRHNLKTGNQIPVAIVAEVDRKIDDGIPSTGSFVFAAWAESGTAPVAPGAAPSCATAPVAGTPSNWNLTGNTAVNCGAATLM